MHTVRTIHGKIKTLPELNDLVRSFKSQHKTIVHCHGVFDLLHPGHIKHLQAAKREGDVLIVTITRDEHVGKGPGRPVFNHYVRAESLAALEIVDCVAINEGTTAVEAIRAIRPDIYVKGSDYADRAKDVSGNIVTEELAVVSAGGRIHFTDEPTFSSSHLINNYVNVFPPATNDWLKAFRKKHTVEEILGHVRATASLKVLIVGEAIIDEYVFCDGLGKSSKDPILAFQYRSTESQAGGSLAVANHLAAFCDQVGLLTMIGDEDGREEYIRKALRPNVQATFIKDGRRPTIHKRRFVDTHTNARMFELYVMDDQPLDGEPEKALAAAMGEAMAGYDLVVVADYGHGMLNPKTIELMCREAPFLAINVQANAGNRGFNTISKYARADYVCLAGHEVALETRMRHADLSELVLEVTKRIECPRFTVTLGKEGILHYAKDAGFTNVPALATRVADRVGAGDAVLALTSTLVAQQVPWDIVGFLGNLAGAQMVADLGNRVNLDARVLAKHIASLMQ